MKIYLTTFYFDNRVLIKRDYVSLEICIAVIENYIYKEIQIDGRIRFWGKINGKYLRVVTLYDGVSIHNAFYDRNFDPMKRGLG